MDERLPLGLAGISFFNDQTANGICLRDGRAKALVSARFGGSKSHLRRLSIGFVSVLPMEKVASASSSKRGLAGTDSRRLFVSQGFNGVHFGGAGGWIDAKDNAHSGADGKGDNRRPDGYDGYHFGKDGDEEGNDESEDDADQSAHPGQDDRFH